MRYPVGPLLERLGITLGNPGRPDDPEAPHGLNAVADHFEVSRGTARRIVACGLDLDEADEQATRLGLHPSAIWPEYWDDIDTDEDWYTDDPPLATLELLAILRTG